MLLLCAYIPPPCCKVNGNILVLYCSWQTQTPLGELTALPQTTLAGFEGAYFSANLFTVDSRRVLPRAGKKPRFFGIFFIGFLGFNAHNAEHRYIIYDPRQVTYMKISVC